MAIDQNELKRILLEKGLLTLEQYASAEKTAKHLSVSVTEVISGRHLVSDEDLGNLIAQQIGVPFTDLKKFDIPDEVLSLIPQDMAIERRAIAFAREGNTLRVAMEDPTNIETIEFIRKKTDLTIEPYYAPPTGIKFALRHYKKGLKEFAQNLTELTQSTQATVTDAEALAQDTSVIHIVDTMVDYAVSENASDIHIEGTTMGTIVRYRIDGILQDVATLPLSVHHAIVARIKILSDLKLDETRLPQDGRFHFRTKEGESISLRVSILPTVEGEKIVLRILESVLLRYNIEELGFSKADGELVKTAIKRPHGLILVTGPTGSGKTTTLYTILGMLNIPEVNISTVEDPVENRIPRINQTQINTVIDFTFANGLRALLRQDPNIIMVGEIRDQETGGIAVNAAMTGHLVLSTLHTNDAPGAIPRLIDLGVEPFLISSTLNLIMAQRLVRLICNDCRTKQELSTDLIATLKRLLSMQGYTQEQVDKHLPTQSSKGEGCIRCHYTGYKGRSGVYEIVLVEDTIRALIVKKATADELKKLALANGMKTMLYDGLEKVAQGMTTVDEVLRVTTE